MHRAPGPHRLTPLLAGAAAVACAAACSVPSPSVGEGVPSAPPAPGAASVPAAAPAPSSPAAPAVAPAVAVEEVAGGFEHAWDVGVLPDGRALVTERPARLQLLSGTGPGATATPVDADLSDVLVAGEGGFMGLVVHPDFAQSRRFTTCQTHTEGGAPVDVRLVTWELSVDGAAATRVVDPLLAGLPLNPSGRHSGCRPTLGPDGALYVGTGDAAAAAEPQDRTSLGGKVLRIDLATGGPAPGNPFADAADPAERLLYTYGHRNVQGVTVQPGTGELFSAEHGPDVDDEVNRLVAGGNYGWDPSQGGTEASYDESVPMTDLERFPDAVPAVWTSGQQTEAISGAAFLDGPRWGTLDGLLAVAALKGSALLLLRLTDDGALVEAGQLPELDGTYGRLRAVRTAPDGSLLVTTSNGADDRVLRVAPAG